MPLTQTICSEAAGHFVDGGLPPPFSVVHAAAGTEPVPVIERYVKEEGTET